MHVQTRCLSGTNTNDMPEELRDALKDKINTVKYWSIPDNTQPITKAVACLSMAPLIMLPCFWPHLIIMSCPMCVCAAFQKKKILATSVVVTETSVEVITTEYDVCCIPGCYKKGKEIRSIPFEKITDVTLETRDKGFCSACIYDVASLKIMDGTFDVHNRPGGSKIQAHENVELLRDKILEEKEIDRHKHSGAQLMQNMMNMGNGVTQVAPMMIHGESSAPVSAEQRLSEIKSLLDKGILTQEEYNKKRSEIISSM